ncbi:DNA polymerase IV [compost metagenome]
MNRVPGVGKVMAAKLAELGVATVGDLRALPLEELEARFGTFGGRLFNRARGVDERPVEPDQPVQSISSEDTFAEDLLLEDLAPAIVQLAEKTWLATRKTDRVGHTVVLKLKTSQFRIITRSFTPESPPDSVEELRDIALGLRARVELPLETRYRLVGVGLGGFREREVVRQPGLFDHLGDV